MTQRQFKFRAWDNVGKVWLMGYELQNLGGFSMFGECMLFQEWSGILNRFILQGKDRVPEDLILMQYTGLKDKNGKEIYEGDVVRNENRTWQEEDGEEPTYSNEISDIIYGNHGFWVNDESFGWEGESLWDWSQINVIGNIYENPELLTNQINKQG